MLDVLDVGGQGEPFASLHSAVGDALGGHDVDDAPEALHELGGPLRLCRNFLVCIGDAVKDICSECRLHVFLFWGFVGLFGFEGGLQTVWRG
eukprot:438292-Rhodomonas_salina.1